MSSAGLEAIELAASAGLVLDDWQQYALMGALGERADGKWSAFEIGLVIARQNGKGAILEARELAGLFLFDEQLILHSAHEFKTAAEAFRRVLMLVEGSDDLRKRVKKVRTSHGDEGIELTTGARLRFVARSTGSGRGFTGDCIILDEAYKLPAEAIGALLPTLSATASGNPQLWYTSSAGHRDSEVLRSVRDRGMTGTDPHLCYMEWSADPASALDDPAAWVQANPALGIRMSAEHVSRELAAMPEAEFRRERLGMWDEGEGENSALPAETWLTLADPSSRVLDPVAFGVDVSPEGYASIASAGARGDGKIHVEIVEHRPGSSWVAERLSDLSRRWTPSAIVLDDGSPAGALLPELERAGLRIEKVTGRGLAQASVAFAALIHDHAVRHIDQADLNVAVAAAKKRQVGDLWAFGRRGSFVDISPLVASALAAWGHAQNAGRTPSIVDPWALEDE